MIHDKDETQLFTSLYLIIIDYKYIWNDFYRGVGLEMYSFVR